MRRFTSGPGAATMVTVPMVLAFAYDGSLHGDWVARYALRFAAHTASRRLRVIHVTVDDEHAAAVPAGLERLATEAARIDVVVEPDLVPPGGGDVASRILDAAGRDATIVTGTRARGRALLARTVSARLLAARRAPVIALRVVHPGVLGQPGRALLPVMARPGFAAAALPLLRLLAPDLERLHLVAVCAVARLRARWQPAVATRHLLTAAHERLDAAERELRAGLGAAAPPLDATVVIAADPAHELALQTARHRARLIALDADAPRGAHLTPEAVLRAAPADVAVFRTLP